MNAFQILEVPEDCEDDSLIKRQYHKLAELNHPDKVQEEDKEAAQARMQLINEAYSQVKDEQCRKAYRLSQKASISFESCEADMYVAPAVYNLQNHKDKQKLFRQWVKRIHLTEWFMKIGCILEGDEYRGSISFAQMQQNLTVRLILDVTRRHAQNPISDTFVKDYPIGMSIPIRIGSVEQLQRCFPSAPVEALTELLPVVQEMSSPIDIKGATKGQQKITLQQSDLQITQTLMGAYQGDVMRSIITAELEAQAAMSADTEVQSYKVADVEIEMAPVYEQLSVVECPCSIERYKFKTGHNWVCANLATGEMVGSYDPSICKALFLGLAALTLGRFAK